MKKLWSKRWFKIVSILSVLLILFVLSLNSIFRGIGSWLHATDAPEQTDMCFVLGGNSYERGLEAYNLYQQFPQQSFIATGGNYPYQILCLDTTMLECELTRHFMLSKGVPASQVDTLSSAHSTMDESNEILHWCKKNNADYITIISSAFHMRRVRMVFEDKFEKDGIKINFHGAAPIEYNELNWWQNEEGMIMTNNELVKILYYAIKY
ncbi:MAG: YdcF family protein [Flavobacteriales bacterium]